MKKRMFVMILAALLVATASACNSESNGNISGGEVSTTASTEASNTEDAVESEPTVDADEQIASEGTMICNGTQNSWLAYKITKSGKLLLHIEEWNEDRIISPVSFADDTKTEPFVYYYYTEIAIAVNSKRACLFLNKNDEIVVISFEKASQTETVTRLSANEDVNKIVGNFTSENTGYLFAFKEVSDGHATGGAKISSLFVTEDGGKTWNPINVQAAESISLREHIIFAKMISKDVGLISGNIFAADYNFCKRTLLTTDGGLNWVNIDGLPQINELQWATVTDFTLADDAYILTVRYTVSEENDEYGYAEYKLNDLNTWIRIN